MACNGALIRELRTEQGHTLRDLAETAGVDHAYLSRVERGQATPTLRWIAAIASAYQIPVEVLMLPDGKPTVAA